MARGRNKRTHRRNSPEPRSRSSRASQNPRYGLVTEDHRYPPNNPRHGLVTEDHMYPPNNPRHDLVTEGHRYPPPNNPRHGLVTEGHGYPPNANFVVEERISAQQQQIQTLLLDNQRIAASHVALRQELSAAEKDFSILSTVTSDVKREKDNQVRELRERSMKMETDIRLLNAQKGELSNVEAEIKKLSSENQDLTQKLEAVNGELARSRVRPDFKERVEIGEMIEVLRREIQQGRFSIEQEKKNRAINQKQSNIMEKHMFSVAREIEELRSELANAEKRARAAVVAVPDPGYDANHGSDELASVGNSNPDQYARPQHQSETNHNSEGV